MPNLENSLDIYSVAPNEITLFMEKINKINEILLNRCRFSDFLKIYIMCPPKIVWKSKAYVVAKSTAFNPQLTFIKKGD